MIKKTFEKVSEDILYEKLDNGIEVYLYKTDKTKNFYMSISVKFGANVTKYKNGSKIMNVIPGSAHFLEHKVMALSENPEISKRINDFGSLANAWTSYYGTNYNIFGSINIIENLKLLLDIFYNTDINEKNDDEEKGIIGEEIDMYKDKIDSMISSSLFNNLFNKSFVKNTIVGERSDIEKINAKMLNQIYKDYYVPNNTFIVVCGNFDEEEIMNVIKEYMKLLDLKQSKIPTRIKEKEEVKVNVPYEEIKKDLENHRVKYALKMKKTLFNIKDDDKLKGYLNMILSTNFSSTSKLYEKYKIENIVIYMTYNTMIVDDYIVIYITAITNNPDKFIDCIKKDIRKIQISKKEFERKKKLYLRNYIMDFDNIEDVEYEITESLMRYNKINYNSYTDVLHSNYEEAKRILSLIEFDNECIIKTIK